MTTPKPIELPDFATDEAFDAGAPPAQVGLAPRLDPTLSQRRQGWYGAKRVPARWENFLQGIQGDWINYLVDWFATIQVRNWRICAKDFEADADANWDGEPIFVETVEQGQGYWAFYGDDNADGAVLWWVMDPGQPDTQAADFSTEIATAVSGMTMQEPKAIVSRRASGTTPGTILIGGKQDAVGLNIFRSVNGGQAYTKVVVDATASQTQADLAAYDPTAEVFYMGRSDTMTDIDDNATRWLYRSTNDGVTWTCISINLDQDYSPEDAYKLCAGGGTLIVLGHDGSENRILFTHDNGDSWDSTTKGDDDINARICFDEYLQAFFLTYEDGGEVFIAYSVDYGETWSDGVTLVGPTDTDDISGFITNQQGTLAMSLVTGLIYFQIKKDSESGDLEFSEQLGASLWFDSVNYPIMRLAYGNGQFCAFAFSANGDQIVALSQRVEPLTI